MAEKAVNSGARQQVKRLTAEAVKRMFPESQIKQWPSGYLPSSGIAQFLRPGGIPFRDVLDCTQEMKVDREHSLQYDLAADYGLWNRCVLEDFLCQLKRNPENRREYRKIKKFCTRDCVMHDEELRDLFKLAPYKPPMPPSMGAPHDPTIPEYIKQQKKKNPLSQGPSAVPTNNIQESPPSDDYGKYYRFIPYAETQEYAMLQVAHVQSPESRVHFTAFPQLRGVIHADFDAMTPLRALSIYAGEDLVLSFEFLQALSEYLHRRLGEIRAAEDAFVAPARALSSFPVTFSTATPIVVFFGNGRLAWLLNETGWLGPAPGACLVRPVQLPWQAARREQQRRRLQSGKNPILADFGLADGIAGCFPCETLSVGDALRKYRPAIAIVEPHVDRDWLCSIRGFHSVREVLVLGPVDSPAMASFAYPFLSFGALPGPFTYWVYNDAMRRVRSTGRVQMPVDTPYEAQGYQRRYVDEVSAYMISPNDCLLFTGQHRCLSFVRRECPVVRAKLPSSLEVGEKANGCGTTSDRAGDGDAMKHWTQTAEIPKE